jgi:hypothetical protein
MRLRGWPVLTVSRGRVVFEDGEVDPDTLGHGRCVTRPRTSTSPSRTAPVLAQS